jgi:hypothetical protein
MSDPRAARDLASRVLASAVRLLPGHRSDWGEAMQAELAALDDLRARRRFIRGCTRAVLSDATVLRTVAVHALALAFGVVALAYALSNGGAGTQIETVAFVVVLGALAWSGGHGGLRGPTAGDRLARLIRSGGYAVLGSYIMLALASTKNDDPSGVWVFYLALALYLATLLFTTARRTAARTRTLQLAAALTIAGLTAWWVPMLLLSGVRANASWALLSVVVTIVLGLAVGTVLRWPGEQVGLAALAAGVATCLLIFLVAQCTYLVVPQLVPEGAFVQLTEAAHVEQDRTEAIDEYVAELLLGALLGALLMATSITSRRAIDRREQLRSGAR